MKFLMEKSMRKNTLCAASVGLLTTIAFTLPGYAQDIQVSQATIQSLEGSDVVSIQLNVAIDQQSISGMEIEGGYVIDIQNAAPSTEFLLDGLKSPLINRVEAQALDGDSPILRLFFYLNDSADYSFSIEGNSISVQFQAKDADPMSDILSRAEVTPSETAPALESTVSATEESSSADPLFDALPEEEMNIDILGYKPSGPDAIRSGTALKTLDFDQQSTISRITIGVNDIGDFSYKMLHDDTIVVDVANAFVPKSLSRPLDTAHFYSPVKMVRAYKYSGGARIAITLKEKSDFNITKSDAGYILVDIPIPATMQADYLNASQASAVVAPDDPQEGISNAYQSEILIGEQGRTLDPQTAFGTGSGSSDPSAVGNLSSGFMLDNTSATSSSFSGKKISIDLVNADIHSVFRFVSHVSKLNIITGDDVSGKITVRMKEVPWDQALSAILQSKGLGSQRFGNIIRVAPIETIKSEQLSALETKRAQEELLELQLLVIPLNYAQASELEGQVRDLLSSRGSLQVDQRGNQLIIKDSEKRLAQIRELIRHLDKQTPQVLIEARVVEASSQFTQMLGIEWGADVHANAATGYPTGLFFPNSVGITGGVDAQSGGGVFYDPETSIAQNLLVDLGAEGSTSGVAFSLGSIPGLINLDARLSAMESDGWGKVVSEPRITTLDNKTAKIAQGARVPFLSTSSGGTQVQFVEATLQMEVTPHITSDNQVFLALSVSNNRPDFSNLVQGQPAIQVKEATTEVLIANGDTTVIGGVFSSETAFSQDKVPGLHKIPLLGYLFKNASDTLSRNELLVFITPHIITRSAEPKSR
jgi:type IV pilus assembly protein PilQ